MFAEAARQRQWSRSANSSSCSSQICDVTSSSRSSQNTAGTDASMSELVSSYACFSQSTDGTDVAMTDIEENVPSACQGKTGSGSSDLSPIFQLQPMRSSDDRSCVQFPVQQ